MGIKYLNKYLRENCTQKSIRKLSLRHLKGKKIVIDTSIYLYRFKEEHALFENMFLLMSVLKHYEIIPLFVFDGKPPQEKKKLLLERVAKKKVAQEKVNNLKESLTDEMSHYDRKRIFKEMEDYERQSIRITNNDIEQVQKLMTLYNVQFVVAPEESDQLCAYLVNKDIAWACMSDDMDMFLYGCKRVLRHTSILHHDVLLYDTTEILSELKLSKTNMTELLLLMGTDYNISDSKLVKIQSFDQVMSWNKIYEKTNMRQHVYDWFVGQEFITESDKSIALQTYNLINSQYESVKLWWKKQNPLPTDNSIKTAALKLFLSEYDGFVF
jgi:hypothetical protein